MDFLDRMPWILWIFKDFLDRMPPQFHMVDISLKVADAGKPPYLMVMMQVLRAMSC